MCFDICAIDIRVSIRVRGLHLVHFFMFRFCPPSPFMVLFNVLCHPKASKLRRSTSAPYMNPARLKAQILVP